MRYRARLGRENTKFTWVFSSTDGSTRQEDLQELPDPPPDPPLFIFTGANAQISSSTIKGKQKTTVYGLFEMPTEFVVVCKKGCP